MAIVLDHTIVPVKNQDETVTFYTTIFGLKGEGRGGREGQFAIVRINDALAFDFLTAETVSSQHFAFAMDAAEFEAIFQRIKAAGIPYGGTPWDEGSMQGPGMTHGARGLGEAVYFRDPSGHLLEIKNY
jgi:catechol 2,3-dioxygenase-like lactoylglutathione lyase family enzyme